MAVVSKWWSPQVKLAARNLRKFATGARRAENWAVRVGRAPQCFLRVSGGKSAALADLDLRGMDMGSPCQGQRRRLGGRTPLPSIPAGFALTKATDRIVGYPGPNFNAKDPDLVAFGGYAAHRSGVNVGHSVKTRLWSTESTAKSHACRGAE